MRNWLIGLLAAGLVTVLLLAGGCKKSAAVKISGSTSVQPFADKLREEFEKKHPEITVQVQAGGSTVGVENAKSGTVDLGMSSRELTADEQKELKPIQICRDGLAIVVNKANKVNSLTLAQARGLFAGQITNWKDVGGDDQAVQLIMREAASGTRAAFIELVMGKEKVTEKVAAILDSTGVVKETVKSNPTMIGYMSLGQVGDDVKALEIDGVKATPEEIMAGRYPLVRPFLFVVKGTLNPNAQTFVDFVLSDEGQKILEKEGLIRNKPVTGKSVSTSRPD